ncbi:MAG: hypothetical protein SF182_24140 [Deltaproteobacteria bacterium]|nr:hypothetical protein [Deltaproteobacteria bacterium]
MRCRRPSSFASVLAALLAALSAAPAGALPLDNGARRCAGAIDKGTAGLAKAAVSVELDCLKRAAKGELGAPPAVEACLTADAKGKLATQRLGALGGELGKCQAGALPAFAVPTLVGPYTAPASAAAFDPALNEIYAETTLAAMPAAAALLLRDAFGAPLDDGVLLGASNAAAARCQAKLARAITGCARAERQAVLTCRKKQLAGGAPDAANLAVACLGSGNGGIPDPKGKLAKKCQAAIDAVLARDCSGQVAAALPGGCGASPTPGTCLVDRVDCRVCQEMNTAGGTARDCDRLDDGLDNSSCGTLVPVCGNDVLDAPAEQCDDGNALDGDCCSATCQLEVTPCPAPQVVIDTPAHGTFSQAAQVTVSGHVSGVNANDAALTLNGAPLAVQPDKTFSTTLAPDTARIFTPAFARLTRLRDGAVAADRVVVIAGAARAASSAAPSGLALRLNDSAFDALEPLLSTLVPPIDLSALLQPGTVLLNDVCYLTLLGNCVGTIDVAIGTAPPPGIDGVAFDLDSQTGKLVASITIQNLALPLTVTSVTGTPLSCDIQLNAPATVLAGGYDLSPLASNPAQIDVVQVQNVAVTLPGLTTSTTCSGSFGGTVQGLVNALIGQLFAQFANGLAAPLNQADGNGNTPIAAALESALAGLDLGTLLGSGLGLDVQAPYSAITEGPLGVSFAADLSAAALTPASGAPLLASFLDVPESFPLFGATTPVGAAPFDAAVGLSSSALNALLRAQTEQGLMRLSTTSIDLGSGAVPLTAGQLATALPAFAALAPATPLTLRVLPTLAPVLSGNAPSGGLAELRLGQVLLEVVENPGVGETVHLRAALDAGFTAGLSSDANGLSFSLVAPSAADLTVAVLANPLGADESAVAALAPAVVGGLLPDLTAALGTIPLPGVIGQQVEISRSPYYTVFAEFGSLL